MRSKGNMRRPRPHVKQSIHFWLHVQRKIIFCGDRIKSKRCIAQINYCKLFRHFYLILIRRGVSPLFVCDSCVLFCDKTIVQSKKNWNDKLTELYHSFVCDLWDIISLDNILSLNRKLTGVSPFLRVTFELFLSGKTKLKIDNEISYKQIELDLVTGDWVGRGRVALALTDKRWYYHESGQI